MTQRSSDIRPFLKDSFSFIWFLVIEQFHSVVSLYIYIYTWIFENRVNESLMFFEVFLILRLSLKDTVSKLRSKEVFLFMSAVFLRLLQQLVA